MTDNSPLTLPMMAEKHPAFPVGSLRWIRFRSEDQTDDTYAPFAAAFIKLGGRVLVDEQRFLEIVNSRAGQ
jgi:hypothetical protein